MFVRESIYRYIHHIYNIKVDIIAICYRTVDVGIVTSRSQNLKISMRLKEASLQVGIHTIRSQNLKISRSQDLISDLMTLVEYDTT